MISFDTLRLMNDSKDKVNIWIKIHLIETEHIVRCVYIGNLIDVQYNIHELSHNDSSEIQIISSCSHYRVLEISKHYAQMLMKT